MDALTALSPRGTDDPLAALGLTPAAQTRRDELGQSEFLELMTTQLQSQDPLEPMENGAFIAQLAQFSTVSGMDRLVETVDTLAQSLAGSSALEAGNLLDRSALVPADSRPPACRVMRVASERQSSASRIVRRRRRNEGS